ncbi:MAG: hypothetical protein N2376_10675 [Clostridia bacterium]|nr:hypothetical protein [Clostridia bacterium]
MKKLIFALFLSVCLALPVASFALPQAKAVDLQWGSIPDQIKLGETIELTATALKMGSGFKDAWTNAQKLETTYDTGTGCYRARAEFKPTKPGSYEISYSITLNRGKSGKSFSGTLTKTIVVTDEKKVTGADIRDVELIPGNGGGSAVGYTVIGYAYALLSDGTALPLDEMITFYMDAQETDRDIPVSFTYNEQEYNFTVHYVR